jgi:hypothetical protein
MFSRNCENNVSKNSSEGTCPDAFVDYGPEMLRRLHPKLKKSLKKKYQQKEI